MLGQLHDDGIVGMNLPSMPGQIHDDNMGIDGDSLRGHVHDVGDIQAASHPEDASLSDDEFDVGTTLFVAADIAPSVGSLVGHFDAPDSDMGTTLMCTADELSVIVPPAPDN